MKDKKKLMIIVALGVVLVGMGAFTLLSGGSKKATPKTVAKKSGSKSHQKAGSLATKRSGSTSTDPKAESAASLNVGEPTEKDSGAAMQEAANGKELTNSIASGAEEKKGVLDSEKTQAANTLAMNLPSRDPFEIPAVGQTKHAGTKFNPVKPPTDPSASTTPAETKLDPIKKSGIRPVDMARDVAAKASSKVYKGEGEEVAPMNPGSIGGALPKPGSNGAGGNGAGMAVKPGSKAFNEDEYPYTLSGVTTGSKSFAILESSGGEQKIARIGDSFGGGKIVHISKTSVVVTFNGKEVRLAVGGGSERLKVNTNRDPRTSSGSKR